ncbi:MAG TPA: serine/threonine-protein kinase, partial [Polyangiales bacterium]|nr:serine/threonine-protein kinase [Polyangiales bacterium]
DSLIGATLAGRYRVEARVGSGAMGAVYRAEHAVLGRRVALKILNRDRLVGGDTVQRFRREAKALSGLHHPNTVRVFDFGASDEGMLYLAMELLEGEVLTDRLVREGALPVPEALKIIQQVLCSISEAHAQSLVHRDLKPDNVYLARVQHEPAPIVKVLDFGIAKAIEGDRAIDQFETLDGTVFGTPRYMSPEEAAGKSLDPRSDLYSVGIMLYELLIGHPPFVDNDAVVVMARHIREDPVPLLRAAPLRPIPQQLEACVAKSLAKSPADRFQTADEFERALAACMPAALRLERLALRGMHRSFIARVWLAPKRTLWTLGAIAAALVLIAASASLLGASTSSDLRAARDSSVPIHDEATPPPQQVIDSVPHRPDATLSAAASARSIVTLQTDPIGAEVFQDGAELGATPLDLSMNPGSTMTLLLRKRGFAEHTLEVRAEDRTRVVSLRPFKSERALKLSLAAQRRHEHGRGRSTASGSPPPTAAARAETPAPVSVNHASPYEKF